MPLVKLASGATSPLALGGYTSTSPLSSTPVPVLVPPKIVPPWETTTLPGAKGPTPKGVAEASVGATSMELAKPTSAHSAPVLMLLLSAGRLVA